MLLQWILEQLNAELSRLSELRAIVAELQTSSFSMPALPLQVSSAEDSAEVHPATPELQPSIEEEAAIRPEVGPRTHRVPRAKGKQQVPTVHALPAGPIVVSAAELQKERAQRGSRALPSQVAGHSRPEISPESAARLLAARWLAGEGQEGTSPAA